MTQPYSDRATSGLALALILAAMAPGVWALRDLQWPYDLDGFRDVAIVQRILDGAWSDDPVYRGEAGWYNPLIPGAVALVTAITGLPTPQASVVTGPWLNGVAAVAFFICLRRLVGAGPACAGLAAFLLLPGRPPAWAAATYSPWLFPSVTAQALMYFGIWSWSGALARPNPGRAIGSGLLLAATFWAHSAAALLFGGIVFATATVKSAWAPGTGPRQRFGLAALTLVVAAALAMPFLFPLWERYGLRIMNREPATWPYEPAHLGEILRGTIRRSALVHLIVAAVGVKWAVSRATPRAVAVLAAWGAVAAVMLGYSLAAEEHAGLPPLVPAYHFFFQLRALQWVLFGCGFMVMAAFVVGRRPAGLLPRASSQLLSLFLIALLAVLVYPRYLGREAFAAAPRWSREFAASEIPRLHRWLRERSPASSVFLSSDIDALQVVAPAGRSAVSVAPAFSNPYVDYQARAAARDTMLALLAACADTAELRRLRDRFGVTHVLSRGDQADVIGRCDRLVRLKLSAGPAAIFELLPSSPPG